jgi:hypothetical protein
MAAPFLKPTQLTNALRKRVATMNKTPEQLHAGLIVFVGRLMAVCFRRHFICRPADGTGTNGRANNRLVIYVACVSDWHLVGPCRV